MKPVMGLANVAKPIFCINRMELNKETIGAHAHPPRNTRKRYQI
jgi:hypothetical protein